MAVDPNLPNHPQKIDEVIYDAYVLAIVAGAESEPDSLFSG
jgi:hypothetical protein